MTETKALLIILAVFIAIPIITFFSAWLTAMMAFDVKQKEEEQEDIELCAIGNAIGSAIWRCKKFNHNCHDCLVDYAKNDELKLTNEGLESKN